MHANTHPTTAVHTASLQPQAHMAHLYTPRSRRAAMHTHTAANTPTLQPQTHMVANPHTTIAQ
jgi:hypothetical protein